MRGPAAVRDYIHLSFVSACHAELRALKPGNVHDYSEGHRMRVADFELSASVAAPFMAETGASIGARVLGAMSATYRAVGQNTNLGILLLAAPLCVAFERWVSAGDSRNGFRGHLLAVLEESTVKDASDVFAAIRIANPGGLGSASSQDVFGVATVKLVEVMAAAAGRDRIARQYVTTFEDIFQVGLKIFEGCLMSQPGEARATSATYFAFASLLTDTHIERKYGLEKAEEIRRLFAERREIFIGQDRAALLAFDQELKVAGINPGTSADLTVASIFLSRLLGYK